MRESLRPARAAAAMPTPPPMMRPHPVRALAPAEPPVTAVDAAVHQTPDRAHPVEATR